MWATVCVVDSTVTVCFGLYFHVAAHLNHSTSDAPSGANAVVTHLNTAAAAAAQTLFNSSSERRNIVL